MATNKVPPKATELKTLAIKRPMNKITGNFFVLRVKVFTHIKLVMHLSQSRQLYFAIKIVNLFLPSSFSL